MQLSDAGKIMEEEWLRGAELRSEIMLDEYVVMPNHFHGIAIIGNPTIPLRGVWIYARWDGDGKGRISIRPYQAVETLNHLVEMPHTIAEQV